MPDPEKTEQGELEPETETTEEVVEETVESPEEFFRSTSEEPAPEPQPKGQPQASKYGGKTPEEMAAALTEKDSAVAQAMQEIARLKHEAQLYKTLAETGGATSGYDEFGAPGAPSPFVEVPGLGPGPYAGGPMPYGYGHLSRPATPPPMQIPPFDPKRVVTEEEWVNDPINASFKLQQAKQEYDRRVAFVQRRAEEARLAPRFFAEGRTAAMGKTPKLFEGIEVQVAQLVKDGYRDRQISADQMRDPKTWTYAAELIRRESGETDFGKYYKAPPKGMPAVQTEKPGAARPAKAGVTLNPEQRGLVALWGMPEDKFLKAYEREIG